MLVPWHKLSIVLSTISFGERIIDFFGSGSTFEISKFWHQGHVNVHDQLPIVKQLLPGQKWNKGFFSTGLTFIDDMRPYSKLYNLPFLFSLVLQKPNLSNRTTQRLLQVLHLFSIFKLWISSKRVHNTTTTTRTITLKTSLSLLFL